MDDAVAQVMSLYPRIFFACHRRHVRDPASKRVLSDHQASILDHLDEHDPLTLSTLARHMDVTPATMSLAIDRLERHGYVKRKRDRLDGRRVLLRLTAAGGRLRDSRTVLEPDRVTALLERLTPEQRTAAVAGLSLLARAAAEMMQERQLSRKPQ